MPKDRRFSPLNNQGKTIKKKYRNNFKKESFKNCYIFMGEK